jgi:alpha-amylase/alpha-mannosidase (GH57 family)
VAGGHRARRLRPPIPRLERADYRAECYAPNLAARILNPEGDTARIVNNYARMSFNFGPTLLAWLEEKAPEVYRSILAADRESQAAFSGHGNALAQAYNHTILPLANRRDKYTQVVWGIRDFEHRFGRPPEGMWLPETAVDLETLEILAELGVRFTILAPHQALRVRRIAGRAWRDVSGGHIDPTMAYGVRLPSGRAIHLFFYDGPISHAVALEGLLHNGESFARRLLSAFWEDRAWPEIVHIANDGETYGHHHRHGDMALAYAVDYIASNDLAEFTNYGEYLARHPPSHGVEIVENTSWSCAHGVERWRNNCGCNTGAHPGFQQSWRAPLREALDWLRDTLIPCYEGRAGRLFQDPWAARNGYIDVILDRSPETLERFWSGHAAHPLSNAEKITALKLLELQHHAMLMYTSCGWFFDDLSRIETMQVIHYAGRAVQLAEEIFGESLECRFLERLEQAKSNIPEHQDGRRIYERFVKPAMADSAAAGADHVSSVFDSCLEEARPSCHKVNGRDYGSLEAGRAERRDIGETRRWNNSFREQLERLLATLESLPPLEQKSFEQRQASVAEQQKGEWSAVMESSEGAHALHEEKPGVLRGETRLRLGSVASEVGPAVAALVERLVRQTDAICFLRESEAKREAVLSELVEVLTRIRALTRQAASQHRASVAIRTAHDDGVDRPGRARIGTYGPEAILGEAGGRVDPFQTDDYQKDLALEDAPEAPMGPFQSAIDAADVLAAACRW